MHKGIQRVACCPAGPVFNPGKPGISNRSTHPTVDGLTAFDRTKGLLVFAGYFVGVFAGFISHRTLTITHLPLKRAMCI